VQLGCGLWQCPGEGHGVEGAGVERHQRSRARGTRVLEQRGLQRGQPPAPHLLRRRPHAGRMGVLDLQDVDLEAGEDAAFDALHQPEFVQDRSVEPGFVHRRDQTPTYGPRTGLRAVRTRSLRRRSARRPNRRGVAVM
jgi:hypothetical protein